MFICYIFLCFYCYYVGFKLTRQDYFKLPVIVLMYYKLYNIVYLYVLIQHIMYFT